MREKKEDEKNDVKEVGRGRKAGLVGKWIDFVCNSPKINISNSGNRNGQWLVNKNWFNSCMRNKISIGNYIILEHQLDTQVVV